MMGEIFPTSIQYPEVAITAVVAAASAIGYDLWANKQEVELVSANFPDPEDAQLVHNIVKRKGIAKRIGYYAAVATASLALFQAAGPETRGPSQPGELSVIMNADNSSYGTNMKDKNPAIVDAVDGSLTAAEKTTDAVDVFVVRGGTQPLGTLPAIKTVPAMNQLTDKVGKILSPYSQTSSSESATPVSDSVQAAFFSIGNKVDTTIIETTTPLSQIDASTLRSEISTQEKTKRVRVTAIIMGESTTTQASVNSYAQALGPKEVKIATSHNEIQKDVSQTVSKDTVKGSQRPFDLPKELAYIGVGVLGIEAVRRRSSGINHINKNKKEI